MNGAYKIFISFFFKKPKPKKVVRAQAGARPGGFRRPGEPVVASNDDEAALADSDSDSSDSESEDNTADEEDDPAGDTTEIDEGQGLHNDRVARTLRGKAIEVMERKGIYIDQAEDKIALQIFPRVSAVYYNIPVTINLFFRSQDLLVVFMILQL